MSIDTVVVRILVVDDEEQIREAYAELLAPGESVDSSGGSQDLETRLFGHEAPVTSRKGEVLEVAYCGGATDAVEAVRLACDAGRPYAVAFVDMRMPPGRDGAWAAERIREIDQNLDIVIVAAYSDIDPREISARVPPSRRLFFVQKPFHPHEIRQLAGALTEKWAAEQRIRHLAYFDEITGLPNRAVFRERLQQALALAERYDRQLALLFLDLDNFKRINDTLGHTAGDRLLAAVAERLRQGVRDSDAVTHHRMAAEREDLARLGGDEFTILLSEIKRGDDAGVVAGRIVEAFSPPFNLGGHEVTMSPSIGVAVFPQDGQDAETLLKNADTAMYHAKRSGKNAFQFYTAPMNETALSRLMLESHLRRALEHGELSLVYQPQVELRDGRISAVEALLRWRNPVLGDVSPHRFIPVAEETGLILAIGTWVLRSACLQARKWLDEGLHFSRMAVNISVRQFVDRGFPMMIQKILSETRLDPQVLELEITESLLMKDDSDAIETLSALKRVGVQLAIDDFGTGYSSLSRLKRFPIDRLKIDQSFVHALGTDVGDAAITCAVIAMADNMRLEVTAEGVETDEQLQFLKSKSCDVIQGFLISRPLPADGVAAFLRQYRSELFAAVTGAGSD